MKKEIEKIVCPDNRGDKCLDHRDCEGLAQAIQEFIEKNYVRKEWHSHYKKSLSPHCTDFCSCDEPAPAFVSKQIDRECIKCFKPIKPKWKPMKASNTKIYQPKKIEKLNYYKRPMDATKNAGFIMEAFDKINELIGKVNKEE